MMKKRLEYALLLLLVTISFIFIPDYVSFYIFAFFLGLPVVSLLVTFLAARLFTAELATGSAFIQKNEMVPLRLTIKNKSLFNCRVQITLVVRNDLMQEEETKIFHLLAGRAGQTVDQPLFSRYCGMLSCRIEEMRIYDYLSLFSFRLKQAPSLAVFVLPSVYTVGSTDHNPILSLETSSEEASQLKAGNDPSEIFDLREYRDGDRFMKIHWKLSEKYDQLIVKEFGQAISNGVLLICDLCGSHRELDGILAAVRSLSAFLLENRIGHDLEWYDSLHERLRQTGITVKDDLSAALPAILAAGRPQPEPWVLKNLNRGNGRTGYSAVLYICSGAAPEDIALLRDQLAGSRVHILLAAESAGAREIAASSAASLEIGLTLLDLPNLEQSLASLTL